MQLRVIEERLPFDLFADFTKGCSPFWKHAIEGNATIVFERLIRMRLSFSIWSSRSHTDSVSFYSYALIALISKCQYKEKYL